MGIWQGSREKGLGCRSTYRVARPRKKCRRMGTPPRDWLRSLLPLSFICEYQKRFSLLIAKSLGGRSRGVCLTNECRHAAKDGRMESVLRYGLAYASYVLSPLDRRLYTDGQGSAPFPVYFCICPNGATGISNALSFCNR